MNLTFTEQIVIAYFEKHPKKILTATIRELASVTCTSTGSIERAVKKLGYENFNHYRYTYKAIIIAEKRFVTHFNVTKSVTVEPAVSQISTKEVLVNLLFRFSGRDHLRRSKRFLESLKQNTTHFRLGFSGPKDISYLSPLNFCEVPK
ncbi:hypothetical protein [Latilactobacillus graminis]|uniref:HTH rpiR-type domain-containing protein n=1 Tax=Latilactobacillus graminis DSM 20719 TaxID=1423752 RepID=A0AA89I109_9LACO|nr:hypothetical protein [Latilactobacillus graminis]KRM22682.1 hypothetical protein FC90_GL000782 [Latilactobacillus graminis DSM 20719]